MSHSYFPKCCHNFGSFPTTFNTMNRFNGSNSIFGYGFGPNMGCNFGNSFGTGLGFGLGFGLMWIFNKFLGGNNSATNWFSGSSLGWNPFTFNRGLFGGNSSSSQKSSTKVSDVNPSRTSKKTKEEVSKSDKDISSKGTEPTKKPATEEDSSSQERVQIEQPIAEDLSSKTKKQKKKELRYKIDYNPNSTLFDGVERDNNEVDTRIVEDMRRIADDAMKKYLKTGDCRPQDLLVEKYSAQIIKFDISGLYKNGKGEKNDYKDENGNTVRVADGTLVTLIYRYKGKLYACQTRSDKVSKHAEVMSYVENKTNTEAIENE